MDCFVTAIGTDSGKTLAAAIICEAFGADYWKPIQSGLPRDTVTVSRLITNKRTTLHPERYLLTTPVSPHVAARIDGVSIDLGAITLPESTNGVVVEGAGGCMAPVNDRFLMVDLIVQLKIDVVVVSNHYLGSINHTLLTLEALKSRNIPLKGLIFNGDRNDGSESIILQRTGIPCLLRISREEEISPAIVREYALQLKENWHG